MSKQAVRGLAYAAIAAGLCWIALAVFSLSTAAATDDKAVVLSTTSDYAGFAIFALALALTPAALLVLHVHQRGADGRLGRVGTAVAIAGVSAQCVVISTIVATGEEPSWFGVAAPLAILTWFVGSILLGVAIRRAGLLPVWVAVLLPVATLLAIVGSEGGTSALTGVFLIVIGARIAAATGAAVPASTGAHEQPSTT